MYPNFLRNSKRICLLRYAQGIRLLPEKKPDPQTTAACEEANFPVDIIRVVAVVLVILLHASIESYGNVMLDAFQGQVYWWTSTVYNSLARVCVPLFVMLSGFLLLQPLKVKEPIRVFLKKRFIRLGLAFAFWSVIYFAWRFFVLHEALSVNSVIQSVLTGSYYHFWFFYLIAGLYLITPILRVVVSFGERKILRYLIAVWFAGVAVVPLFQLITGFYVDTYLILIAGWLGYFVLGAYLQKIQLRKSILIGLIALGYAWTIYGSWVMAFPFHDVGQYYFFFDSLTINVVIASVAMFLLLSKVRPDWPGKNYPLAGRLVRAISQNSLPIYVFQLIILETLQKGYLGFKISLTEMNPIIEIPLITAVTLFVTLGLVLLMRQVPVLRRLIG
jgi:surface polysaccharide O-acyltransferase-like enzyme